MSRKKIECGICKKIFNAPAKTGSIPKYCSDECKRKAHLISIGKYADKKRLKETRCCPVCGDSFIAEGKAFGGKRYCSKKCARKEENRIRRKKHAENVLTSICPQCGKRFKHYRKGTYCSTKCYTESSKAKEQTSICLVCGQEFKQKGNKRKYCSVSCSVKAQAEVYRRNTMTRRALSKTNGRIEMINPKDIFERDGWRCQLCGKKVDKRLYKTKGTRRYPNAPSIDHIIPISKGGEHVRANVQCACYICNCKKGARELGQLRLFG
jgi:5-methylcytosine-specific restriction endonuclease McrA